MKKIAAIHIIIAIMALAMPAARAQQAPDTCRVWNSWEGLLWGDAPDTTIIAEVSANSPYDFAIEPVAPKRERKAVKKRLKADAVAMQADSVTWLANSDWLKKWMGGDCRNMAHWVPVYFSNKIAFLQWQHASSLGVSVANALLMGLIGIDDIDLNANNYKPAHFYLLDFANNQVREVDHELLDELLDNYPRIKQRWQARKNYDKTEMVNEYFLMYVDALNADASAPPAIE